MDTKANSSLLSLLKAGIILYNICTEVSISSVMIGGSSIHERRGRGRGEVVLCWVEVEEVIRRGLDEELYGLCMERVTSECVREKRDGGERVHYGGSRQAW